MKKKQLYVIGCYHTADAKWRTSHHVEFGIWFSERQAGKWLMHCHHWGLIEEGECEKYRIINATSDDINDALDHLRQYGDQQAHYGGIKLSTLERIANMTGIRKKGDMNQRDILRTRHQAERDALRADEQKERDALRDKFLPVWAALWARQKAERNALWADEQKEKER